MRLNNVRSFKLMISESALIVFKPLFLFRGAVPYRQLLLHLRMMVYAYNSGAADSDVCRQY
jgi:hypothetical protein